MRITDKYVYFWGEFLSNFFMADIYMKVGDDLLKFHSTEQYFMFMKAKTFGDEEMAKRILYCETPKEAKKLGRKVSNFNDDEWSKVRYQIMLDANIAKYTQNLYLQTKLLSQQFENKHFVEASPYDSVWGIKCSMEDAKDDQSNWNGQNLLGQVLDEVRNLIK